MKKIILMIMLIIGSGSVAHADVCKGDKVLSDNESALILNIFF